MASLKKLRQENSLRQLDLAQMLGVDRTTVTKWENGSALPRADKLIKMAKIFNCTVDALLQDQIEAQRKGELGKS